MLNLTFHGFFLYHFLLLSANLKWEGGKFFLICSADKNPSMFFHYCFSSFLPECQNKRVQCSGLGIELSFSLEIKLRSYEFSCKFSVCRWSMITKEQGFVFPSILSSSWTTLIIIEGLFLFLITTQHWKFLPGCKFQIFSSSWQSKVAKLIREIGESDHATMASHACIWLTQLLICFGGYRLD